MLEFPFADHGPADSFGGRGRKVGVFGNVIHDVEHESAFGRIGFQGLDFLVVAADVVGDNGPNISA